MVDVMVTKEGDSPPEAAPEPEVELPVRTPRLSLRLQRQEILDNLYLDLKVPRWTTVDDEGKREIYVRYAPIQSALVEQSIRRRSGEEYRQNEASLLVHADLLVNHCRGVFAVMDDDFDRKYTLALDEEGNTLPYPTEEWTRFDRGLARALGMAEFQWGVATDICRALYVTDGDLIDASNELSGWSSAKNERAAEDFTRP
jgi:hypothetical protein